MQENERRSGDTILSTSDGIERIFSSTYFILFQHSALIRLELLSSIEMKPDNPISVI